MKWFLGIWLFAFSITGNDLAIRPKFMIVISPYTEKKENIIAENGKKERAEINPKTTHRIVYWH